MTVFTTAALGVVVYYLLQRLKVTEAHLALLDRKSRQNVDIGEVKSLLRNEIPNLRRLLTPQTNHHGKTQPPGGTEIVQQAGGETSEAPSGLTFGAASPVQGPVRRLEEDDDQQEEEEEKTQAAADSPGSD